MRATNLGKMIFSLIITFTINSTIADITHIDFLIPGGEGGGWDTTARQTGQALIDTKLIKSTSYKNLSGGGGGRAIISLITETDKYKNTLMVQSTPLILRNLSGIIPHCYRDITPVSLLIAEYQVLVVPSNSTYKSTYAELLKSLNQTDKWQEVRSKYGWADYLKSGEELKAFLESQENSIKDILKLIQ
ncbi:hypothetical protein H0A36_02995 [Endozoicomonas sp. SM1973]|uniref:Tripartite tricarboxylate transporter substrate binding protein n=1 Tax=Spartinivicinus marinus TaxID=2994442 RepID=A0A853HX57_9GAMM|nr:hypothetical protein [Spartinivicinus marinus]MCX4029384.1 hypothetical protein [Spartinivicinus marinus]NYZ64959.1 hypothetical protein [Spartinivicinus marinus]